MNKSFLLSLTVTYMKTRIIMLSLLGLFYLLPSYAQTFRMGIAGGMNISSTDCSESKAGFRAGVTGEYSFKDPSNGLFLSVGMLLAHQPYKGKEYFYQEVNATKRWDATPFYLSIPLHVGYKMPCGQNVNVFASAGPYLGIGLFGKEKCFTEDITGRQIEEETSSNVFSDKHQERLDYGVGLRLGAEFGGHFQISAGYDWGLKDINSNFDKNRNHNFNVSLAYMF